MKPARSLPPRYRRSSRTAALLALVLTGWGCQQPPVYVYYGPGCTPGCPPAMPVPGAPINGPAVESAVDGGPSGQTYIETPTSSRSVSGSQNPPHVVVSEPETSPRGFFWRGKNDPEPIATSVEGATTTAGDSSVYR